MADGATGYTDARNALAQQARATIAQSPQSQQFRGMATGALPSMPGYRPPVNPFMAPQMQRPQMPIPQANPVAARPGGTVSAPINIISGGIGSSVEASRAHLADLARANNPWLYFNPNQGGDPTQ